MLAAISAAALFIGAILVSTFAGWGRSGPTSVGIVPITAEASVLSEPGDDVVPGVDVPEGTQMVGQPVPSIGYGLDGSDPHRVGWQALFIVTDDPIDTWRSMAEELGVGDDDRADPTQACFVTEETAETLATGRPSGRRLLTEQRVDGENLVSCDFYNKGVNMSMRVGANLRCTGRYGASKPCGLNPVAHLRSGIDESQATVEEPPLKPNPGLGDEIVEFEPPNDLEPRSLLSAGAAYDDGTDYHIWNEDSSDEPTQFFIPDGGRSVVVPADFNACTGDVVGMLEFDQPAAESVELMADQLDRGDEVVTGQWDDNDWAYVILGSPGAQSVQLTGVDKPGGSTVLFSDCGD